MFGRLNAKLAHLKANSQRAQTQESGASLSPATAAPAQTDATESVFGTSATNSPAPHSAATSRAASPSPQITSFQAARVAASHAVAAAKGLSLNIQSRHNHNHNHSSPASAVPNSASAASAVNPSIKSYHIYVETPLENAFPPILSPTESTTKGTVAANKRRLSSPRVDPLIAAAPDTHQAKHTRLDSAIINSPHAAAAAAAIQGSHYLQQPQQLLVSAEATSGGSIYSTPGSAAVSSYSPIPLPAPNNRSIQPHIIVAGNHPASSLSAPYYAPALIGTSYGPGSHHHSQIHQHYANASPLGQQMLSQPNRHPFQQHQPPAQELATQPAMREHQSPCAHEPHGQPRGDAARADTPRVAATRGNVARGDALDSSNPQSDGRTLNDYQLLHTLGTGTFGRVFLSQSKLTGRYYAMKVLRKSQVVKLKQVEHINNEKSILEVARHPFIVQLECTMQNERNLYMLMEYVPGGELFSHLRRAGRFPDDVTRFYAAEIVLALDYLHSMKIIWRDTKPENILLDAGGHVKLTDFGFAKRVEERTWTLCGTPEYLAPEIIQSKGHGKAVDWWALGVLVFEMLAGYPPFYDDNPFGIYEKILEGKLVFPAFFTAAARDLIARLLTADVSKRLGNLQGEGADVKAHAWFALIDWDVLVARHVPPPIVPPHRHPGDTCNFDKYPEPPQEPAPEPGLDPYRHLFATF
ncbi:cAMP-dependent protein kinase catalytic subunit [Coemansia spiralis]|uniref:cAMP-dependent protein kinase n=2 Tax=Coemansia TaxID=4863 RepID=A0A9W8G6R5_9FUNG|nr:cAMP-dependent protein kinase catalytic subunit [Coemansia umbellata]KAJ2624820.1 cAMP-dependent protein kinase catalytic subunit [Coemansia sp. RSA 1358]KAJ2674380.1 cAMP-dependent protein kinase catalytic subunit [Coemansia spiralis]